MPVHNLCFRVSCGRFVSTYLSFMAQRASHAVKMRVQVIRARGRLDILWFVFVASYFLCCGDVEMNPGPTTDATNVAGPDKHNEGKGDTTNESNQYRQPETVSKQTTPVPTAIETCIAPDMAAQILKAIQQQGEKFESLETNMHHIQTDLSSIKTDIGVVKSKCDAIDKRCDKLESNYQTLTTAVHSNKDDVEYLFNSNQENKEIIADFSSAMSSVQDEMSKLHTEIERLEEFSRRDNLRLYGVPETEEHENYDACAKAVADVLNSVEGQKKWTPDDIARAHRVGESRDGQPKPMIVKFCRWKDKMSILTNKQYRDSLFKKGVRAVNDLTRNQAKIVAEAKREGNVAFFKRGKLVVQPREGQRLYADAAADEPREPTTQRQPAERQADHNNRGKGQRQWQPRGRHGDSPVREQSTDRSQRFARDERRDSRGTGSQQSGLHRFWGEGERSQRSHNNSQGLSSNVRRSERNKK